MAAADEPSSIGQSESVGEFMRSARDLFKCYRHWSSDYVAFVAFSGVALCIAAAVGFDLREYPFKQYLK